MFEEPGQARFAKVGFGITRCAFVQRQRPRSCLVLINLQVGKDEVFWTSDFTRRGLGFLFRGRSADLRHPSPYFSPVWVSEPLPS